MWARWWQLCCTSAQRCHPTRLQLPSTARMHLHFCQVDMSLQINRHWWNITALGLRFSQMQAKAALVKVFSAFLQVVFHLFICIWPFLAANTTFVNIFFYTLLLCFAEAMRFLVEWKRSGSRKLSINQLHVTPYRPMVNGLGEKLHGTLKRMLKKICQGRPKDWGR